MQFRRVLVWFSLFALLAAQGVGLWHRIDHAHGSPAHLGAPTLASAHTHAHSRSHLHTDSKGQNYSHSHDHDEDEAHDHGHDHASEIAFASTPYDSHTASDCLLFDQLSCADAALLADVLLAVFFLGFCLAALRRSDPRAAVVALFRARGPPLNS
jgi:ABC-type nickel/cobalt efflux system permease component RcnA